MAIESMIEKAAREYIEARGGKCMKFVSPGNNGVPDRVLSHRNCGPFWCEFKAPGKKMKPHQEQMALDMARAGFRVYRDVSTIRKAIEIIDAEITPGAFRKHEPVSALGKEDDGL